MENTNITWIEKLNDFLSRSVTVKLGTIAFLILLLLIPESMITSLIREREQNMKNVMSDISGKWSGPQHLTGPVLVVPYLYSGLTENGNVLQKKQFAFILPDSLSITGHVMPEKRSRGIYNTIVYTSDITISGTFSAPDFASLGINDKDVPGSQASVQIGISDMRGIENSIHMDWDSSRISFNPGNTSKNLFASGISADLPFAGKKDLQADFSIHLSLRGSENLFFTPLGKVTYVQISSPWDSPSFTGAFLPVRRNVTGDGFSALWKILHFNRNYPQQWTDGTQDFEDSQFGVHFMIPSDHYLKSLRSVKYSVLVVALTFLVFFLVEILARLRIHPVQYVLVGLSLILFYLLLLSISEQLGFNAAYFIAALMIISVISLYAKSIVKRNKVALLLVAFLVLTYGFIYIIIQLENYSLLVGSMGLFAALSLTMYITRKVDWFGNKERNSA